MNKKYLFKKVTTWARETLKQTNAAEILLPFKRDFLSRTHITTPIIGVKDKNLDTTLLIPVPKWFDQAVPGAITCIYEGFARAWSESMGPVKIIPEKNIVKELEKERKSVVFANVYNFFSMQDSEVRHLRNFNCIVWVGVHPRRLENFLERYNNCRLAHNPLFSKDLHGVYEKLLLAEPKFVWNSVGESGREWYQDWIDDGFRFERIQLAADPHRYFPDPAPEKFGDIKMAYVGGYWKEKANAFDLYLRQFEDILVPFGYDGWPYKHYGGQLDFDDERRLYSSAGLIPLITGPAGWSLGELTERYYKAPACRAFCIADQSPALREFFSEDEMLQAESPEHFKYLVYEYLKGGIDTNHWREKAYRAVQERHLYKHRVGKVRDILFPFKDIYSKNNQ